MFLKRSTRAIVAGRRAKPRDASAKQAEAVPDATVPFENGTVRQNIIQEENSMQTKKIPVWVVRAAAGVVLLIIVGTALFLFLRVLRPAKTLPEISGGQVVASVRTDAALTGAAKAGDVVRLYGAGGKAIPELQYVQIYQTAQDGGLLILTDDTQAAVLAAQSETRAMLVVHDDPVRAGELLALQARINDPAVTLRLPDILTLQPGEAKDAGLSVLLDPADGIPPEIVWESADDAVAAVDPHGVVTGIAPGETMLTVRAGGASARVRAVVAIPLTAIRLSAASAALVPGDTCTLAATAEPENATGFKVTWRSSDDAVASVSDDGMVTAQGIGQAVILASCGDVSAECTITVGYHAQVAQLDKAALTVSAGQSSRLAATVYPGEGILDAQLWESSNPAICTVSEDGTVTGVAPGTATVTFRCGEATASCTVTVTAAS